MEDKFCKHCGTGIEPDGLFCPSCGEKVTDIGITDTDVEQTPGAPRVPEPPEISEFAQPPLTEQPIIQQPPSENLFEQFSNSMDSDQHGRQTLNKGIILSRIIIIVILAVIIASIILIFR